MVAAPQIPELEGVEHRYATVGGLRLHYAEAGDPSAPPVILQHGWPQHWWIWRHLIPALAENHRVIAPDLRGHGWSDKPRGDYRKDTLMRDIVGLLDQLEIEKVRWVGHDWGGYTGMLAALRHPERIDRFVCLSIPHPWPEGRARLKRAGTLWYQLVLAAPLLGKRAIGSGRMPRVMLKKGRAKGSFTEAELRTYLDVLEQPDATAAGVAMYRHFLQHELVPAATGGFHDERLTVPTRWIVGERDAVSSGNDDSYKKHADDMTLEELPGVGHFLPEEVPDLLRERVLDFF
jgi:pimeloyl-ACP methyl ester carboxylesterase